MGFIRALVSLVTVVMATVSPIAPTQPTAPHLQGVWPVQPPRVVRGFEPPSDQWSAGHRGVDLAGTLGISVAASVAGTITFAGMIAGRGVVVISHGDTRTTYEPVLPEVSPGQEVSAGDQIGGLDVTQSHCFPSACLHWGWIRDQEYLDPLLLVPTSDLVQLLPLELSLTPADAPADRRP